MHENKVLVVEAKNEKRIGTSYSNMRARVTGVVPTSQQIQSRNKKVLSHTYD